MNRRNVVLAAIAAFALLAATGFGWFSSEPVLTVYLRCDGEVSGTLSVTTVLENGKQGSEESFDLETVCKAGKVEFRGYLSKESLKFVFKRGDGETVEVTTQYGHDIQRDQNGFYAVLKIMNTPPFIANDRI